MSLAAIVLVLLAVAGAIAYVVWKHAQNSTPPARKGHSVRPGQSNNTLESGAAKKSAVKRSGKSAGKSVSAPANPYRATSIKPGNNACEAVLKLQRSRFLVAGDHIPALPLEGCDSSNCTCKYVKHSDRRNTMEADRRALGGLHRNLMSQSRDRERRAVRRGRRAED